MLAKLRPSYLPTHDGNSQIVKITLQPMLFYPNRIRYDFAKDRYIIQNMKINKSFMVAIFLILRISYENFRGFHKKFEELKIYAFDLLPSFYVSIFQKARIIIILKLKDI